MNLDSIVYPSHQVSKSVVVPSNDLNSFAEHTHVAGIMRLYEIEHSAEAKLNRLVSQFINCLSYFLHFREECLWLCVGL